MIPRSSTVSSTASRCAPILILGALSVTVSVRLEGGGALAGEPAAIGLSFSRTARAALRKMDLRRGICAVIGMPEGGLPGKDRPGFVTDLAKGSELVVYFQTPSADEADQVRKAAEAAGLLAGRVFVGRGDWKSIHLADNLAGAVWVAGRVAEKEVLRVLHPGGRAILGGKVIVKASPEGIDAWSHPYHGPDNNPQSTDLLARAPYLTQFLAEPKWCPMPEVSVAAGGRIFKAYGHIAHKANQNALLNTLLCINAYNGTILWKRPLREGFMLHRNTMIATPEFLYMADDESCRLLDAATGEVTDRIVIAGRLADGGVWKWMALEGGVLYALIGGEEVRPPTRRSRAGGFGHWPWGMWEGHDYKDPKTNFGYGRTILAVDPATKKVLWHHREEEYLDSRGVCMKNGRIYIYSPQKFLACLDARKGKVLWKTSDAELLAAIGPTGRAQHYVTGFATTTYIKCSDRYVFFAGPQRANLVVVSAEDGKLAWQRKDGNLKIVLREDALYAAGGQKGGSFSSKLDYDTGRELVRFPGRRACTRATGSVDSVFFRAHGGTVRIDTTSDTVRHIAPMRPPCQDGVIISDGLLYWGPWMCGCALSLHGHICLGPAGDFDFRRGAHASRLERGRDVGQHLKVPTLRGRGPRGPDAPGAVAGDWPAYRGDNQRTCTTGIAIPEQVRRQWTFRPRTFAEATSGLPTAPVAAGGTVLVADRSGVLRALDAADGGLRWKAYTGGAIFFPPAVWKGRVYVGSADGWVYALEGATGQRLWRFRVAPRERLIPVYGRLMSTWPVAGGVVVEKGILYAAAGIAHYDGTHVCALDALTGKLRWYNDSSGELSATVKSGVSLQGNLYLRGGQLRFPGGNATGEASYDLRTGRCLNAPPQRAAARCATVFEAYYPRYADVSLSHTFPDGRTLQYQPSGRGPRGVMLLAPLPPDTPKRRAPARKALWRDGSRLGCRGLIIAKGTAQGGLLVTGWKAGKYSLAAVRLEDGSEIWTHELPARPVRWGSAVDHRGRIFVSLEDGRVLAFW